MTSRLPFVALFVLGGCLSDREPLFIEPFEEDVERCELETYPCGEASSWSCGAFDVIKDLSFIPANEAALAATGDDDAFDLHDLYQDEGIAGILLFGTAGWCQYCGPEGLWLNSVYGEYQDLDGEGQRLEFVAVIFQDEFGDPATAEYAEEYAEGHGFLFPAVADPTGAFLDYFDPNSSPGNVFVNRSDMTIRQVIQGFHPDDIAAGLGALDGLATCQ